MKIKTTNNIGKEAENIAVKHVKENGLKILETNFYSRFGEIDIIASSKESVHFIEVKATSKDYDPLERITKKKLEKIIKTVNFYMLKNNINSDFQIDAILVKDRQIEWIKNIYY